MDKRNFDYMKRALITGSRGFVGPYLKRELESSGFDVFGLGKESREEEGYYQADITDTQRLLDVVREVGPTHIAHLAGIGSPVIAEANPKLTEHVQVDGTRNLLSAAARLAAPPRILLVSSAYVYGAPQYLPIDEDHPTEANNVYARARLAQEAEAVRFQQIPIVIARSFNHTGPGQPDTFVIPKMAKQIVEISLGRRRQFELGNIDVRRDITDVRDVARAYRLLLTGEEESVIVNVCRGQSILLRDVIAQLARTAGLGDLTINTDQRVARSNDPIEICGSHEKLTRLTGWQPQISYEQMLQDMFHYWWAAINNVRSS